jgi:threonine synthase
MLDILKASNGIAMAVTDQEILASILDWARNEGIFFSPEGASVNAAYDKLLADGTLKPTDLVVLFNTGAGLKYTDVIAEAMHLKRPAEELQTA